MKLTERKIETLTVGGARKDRLVFDDSQRGLAVRVTASRSRSYLCQYTLNGQKWRGPLGGCWAGSLSQGHGGAPAPRGGVGEGEKPAAPRGEGAGTGAAESPRGSLPPPQPGPR